MSKMGWQGNSSWLLKRQFILWSKQLPTWKYAKPYQHTPFYFLWQLLMPAGSVSEEKSVSVKWWNPHKSSRLALLTDCWRVVFHMLRIQKKQNKQQPTANISKFNGQVKHSQKECYTHWAITIYLLPCFFFFF